MKSPHTISWFEIPVSDISRATKFYENVLQLKMATTEMNGNKMAIFPTEKDSPVKA